MPYHVITIVGVTLMKTHVITVTVMTCVFINVTCDLCHVTSHCSSECQIIRTHVITVMGITVTKTRVKTATGVTLFKHMS